MLLPLYMVINRLPAANIQSTSRVTVHSLPSLGELIFSALSELHRVEFAHHTSTEFLDMGQSQIDFD